MPRIIENIDPEMIVRTGIFTIIIGFFLMMLGFAVVLCGIMFEDMVL